MTALIVDFLQNQHPFTLLTEDELERVKAAATTATVPAGRVIIHQGGEISTCLHLLGRGHVVLLRDGEEVQELDDGDCFGYPSIISQAPPALEAVAAEESVLHCIPADLFRDLLHANALFAEFFLKSLGERLQRATRREGRTIGGELTTPVGELELRAPVTVAPGASVAEAARAMRGARVDVVLVTAEPPGIITDHDFQTKVLAEGLGPDTPVADVMTRPLKTLPADALVHHALLFMLDERIHHLPVTVDGDIRGILSATDLLRHQTRNPVYLMRQFDNVDSPEMLGTYARDMAAMVERLFHGGLNVGQVGRICASLNDTLLRSLLRLAERELGEPPCPYAWLVFGSEGRMEQAIINDQDNALAYAEDTPEARAYFGRLTRHVVDNLVAAGFPPCPGGYMATNWHKPLAEWQATVSEWIRSPAPDNLMVSAIFFDFRVVGGALDVSALDDIVAGAHENQLFMAHLTRVAQSWRSPLDIFRRIRTEGGQVDIKTGGVAALVGTARAYGLAAGCRARPTRERFEAAMEAGVLSRDLGHTAVETYRFLLQLRLRDQLAEMHEGREPDNLIDLKQLSSLEQRHLKDAFGVIRQLQDAAGRHFRTQSLG